MAIDPMACLLLWMETFSCPFRFLPFLEQSEDMNDFCQREVEPMGKECEQVGTLRTRATSCSREVLFSTVELYRSADMF